MKLIVRAGQAEYQGAADELSRQFSQQFSQQLSDLQTGIDGGDADDQQPVFVLEFGADGLSLQQQGERFNPLTVNFCGGAQQHRRLYGGGKNQPVAKAVGLSKGVKPSVLDCTAGLGRDAFVLASLGCSVTLLERHPVIAALLADGLDRALHSDDQQLLEVIGRMQLLACNALDYLLSLPAGQFDVIYLDPMFPERKKTALVKKDMQLFHRLLGADEDGAALLELALRRAKHRVVVKRPAKAEALAGKKPMYCLEGKSGRFDIYSLRAFAG